MNEHVRIVGDSRATTKGQTTIPKQVRDAMGIKEGTALTWIYEDGRLTVRAKTKRLEDFAGMLGPPPNGGHVTVEEMNEGIGRAVAKRFLHKTSR